MKLWKRLALAAGIALSISAAAQEPIKIGFIAELSGPQGALGQDQYDAFMMVVERNNGRLGGVPVQILKEDTQLKPEVANQVVDKLIEKEKVSIIAGVTFSNIAMTVHKKVVQSEVFLISSNAGPSPLAGAQCSPFFFNTNNQNDERAEVVGKYAADKGYKRVYAMAPNYQAGKDFVSGFKRLYKQPLLEEIYTPLNQLDFQAELAQLAAAKPDAVWVFYPGGLGVQFVRQWRQSGLAGKIPLLTSSTVDGITLPALQDAALGVIDGSLWSPELDIPQSRRFVAEFEKRYKRVPSVYAAQSYDSALLLDSAIAKVKGRVSDKKAFQAALKAADFSSVRGNFKFNNNNFPIQDFYAFEVIKDANGRYTYKTLAKVLPNHEDAYHSQCGMK
ncbi:MAG TPA: ABC transporter substrate-binding protein [Burkholderiales bacterium]|nr:ABC transporter substrate-binding protein [Burkholderiales bacterium]